MTKTDGTARYEVAIYPASQTPDDIEAYVQANKKFSRKTNGTVEFVDLDPATPYVIASLSYDAYDLPCEVRHTKARVWLITGCPDPADARAGGGDWNILSFRSKLDFASHPYQLMAAAGILAQRVAGMTARDPEH